MRIAEIQQFLRSLVEPLNASGAKAPASELERMCLGFDPFKEKTIKEFNGILGRLFDYETNGTLTIAPKPARTPRASTPKPPKMTVEEALAKLRSLYERAGDEGMTHTAIQAEVKALNVLTAKDLDIVMQQFGLGKGKGMKKEALLEAIERKIADRRASHQRLLSIHE